MGDVIAKSPASLFTINTVTQAPDDPIYELINAFEADTCNDKVDLGVGAYRDDNAKPWILPVITKAEEVLRNDQTSNHEYLPIAGLPSFVAASQKLILGAGSAAIREHRVCSFQTISGTGAVHLGAAFLSKFSTNSPPTVYLPKPTWPIHDQVFTTVGVSVEYYPYFDPETKTLDFKGMYSAIQSAPEESIILLHACAHNPTGVDPSFEQWREIAELIQQKRHFPFFDCAYQGFASGSLDTDNLAIRHFVELGMEVMIAQSFAKNMGLYGQRVGAFHYVAAPGNDATKLVKHIASQLAILQRSELSSPPIYGAKLASIVLDDEDLFRQWQHDLRTMSGRIVKMRHRLKQELDRMRTPGNWDHIVAQIGMFSFTGLNEAQVQDLRSKWHVYMLGNGRISMSGLNSSNVKYFAAAIDDVVRRVASLSTS